MCRLHVSFSDTLNRTAFLRTNAHDLVRAVQGGNLHVLTDAPPGLTLIVRAEDCSEAGLRRMRLQAEGMRVRRGDLMPIDEARGLLDRQLRLGLRSSDVQRSCVVSLRPAANVAEQFVFVLPFTGLSNVQIESAQGVTYVAADEDCSLLREVVVIAMEGLSAGSQTDVTLCSNASLEQCGYPPRLD
jgi:hypothetical protein